MDIMYTINIQLIQLSLIENKYIAAKNLTAYTSTSGTKKAFTIKKGSKAYIYALYQNGSKRYIKVKNSSGNMDM